MTIWACLSGGGERTWRESHELWSEILLLNVQCLVMLITLASWKFKNSYHHNQSPSISFGYDGCIVYAHSTKFILHFSGNPFPFKSQHVKCDPKEIL
uniref:Guanine nucleotide-binding protein subunit gamma n=1 Tax=Parascaris univalens TaxID=6257 RepID=A0A914ZEF1_PARUN